VLFSDLHDTPGRMKAKDVIIDKISWKDSRYFFFNRLRRLLAEDPFLKKIREFKPKCTVIEARSILSTLYQNENKNSDWKCDEAVYKWLTSSEQNIFNQIEKEYSVPGQIQIIHSILQSNPHSLTILKGVLQNLSPDQIKELFNSTLPSSPPTPTSSEKNTKPKININKKSNKK